MCYDGGNVTIISPVADNGADGIGRYNQDFVHVDVRAGPAVIGPGKD